MILRGFDESCRKTLQNEMKKSGVNLELKANISKVCANPIINFCRLKGDDQVVKRSDGSLEATLTNGKVVIADQVSRFKRYT